MLVSVGLDPSMITELALLAVFLGTVLPFAPAEPALLSGGALAAAGEVSLAAVIGIAAVGCVLCDLITYRLGWVIGPPMLRWLGRRAKLGSVIGWTEARLAERAEAKLVGLRVVPTGGFVVPMVCGVFRLPLRRFVPISLIGSTAFSVRGALLGFAGGWLAGDLLIGLASSFVVALLLTVAASWWMRHHPAPKQTSGAESTVDTASANADAGA